MAEPDLPLWELIQTSHVVARRFTEVFAEAGLTPTQFGVLAALADEPDLSQADLARIVLVRPQSMTHLIASLLERGLVNRQGPGGRGRRTGVQLTAAGQQALQTALPGVHALNAPATIGLDAQAAATLTQLLRTVRTALQ